MESFAKALDCFDEALKRDPLLIQAYNNKADMFNKVGNYSETIKCCDAGLRMNPLAEKLWVLKGEAFLMMGAQKQANSCFVEALNINPKGGAWYYKAASEEQMNQIDEAVLSYKKFIEYAPSEQIQTIEFAKKRIAELGRRE